MYSEVIRFRTSHYCCCCCYGTTNHIYDKYHSTLNEFSIACGGKRRWMSLAQSNQFECIQNGLWERKMRCSRKKRRIWIIEIGFLSSQTSEMKFPLVEVQSRSTFVPFLVVFGRLVSLEHEEQRQRGMKSCSVANLTKQAFHIAPRDDSVLKRIEAISGSLWRCRLWLRFQRTLEMSREWFVTELCALEA